MLDVNEIFGPTIQGEGKLLGTPSIFIRFSKCNMTCSGFGVEYKTENGQIKKSCDTYYAVDTYFKKQWEKLSSEDIIDRVSKLHNDYKIDIVITGGEPLLYWHNEEFQKILEHYIRNGNRVTIETNASLNIDFTKDYQKEILFSMSVKLSNSLETIKKRVNIQTLTKILTYTKDSYLKFVVSKENKKETIVEIKDIVTKIPNCEVYLMPMGSNTNELNKNSESIINLAIENAYKYSDRLHIRIWDNKRGV